MNIGKDPKTLELRSNLVLILHISHATGVYVYAQPCAYKSNIETTGARRSLSLDLKQPRSDRTNLSLLALSSDWTREYTPPRKPFTEQCSSA